MATLGYARVSTSRQSLDQQTDALTAAGAEKLFSDKLSGARADRPGLAELLEYAREGDVVVVVALDRLGRDLVQVIQTANDLTERGIVLRSLREGVDFSTAMGRMVMAIFAALAEYERTLIIERSAAAREAAAARGVHVGRKPTLSPEKRALAKRLKEAGESVPTIVEAVGASRSTVYRALSM